MATGAAGDGFIRGMFEGCLSGGDMGIQRRPYHKNCKCALHNSRGGHCTRHSRYNNVSYPIRRAWSESNLALMVNAPAQASPSGYSSPSSPAVGITRTNTQLVLCKEEDQDDEEGEEMQGVAFSISMSKV
ncbi:hypothetical protein ACJIZ3_025302 [Penstemon smallii]|uniref:Uncharacterized protein n=1 Tax=Penstemon smallii TaxID=265156 RepID=A0ABD3TUA1_9LAMI